MGSNKKDKWEVENLRLDSSLVGVVKPKPIPGHRGRVYGLFIRGPIPVSWCREAKKLGLSAYAVGVALWHLCGRNYNKLTFSVSNMSLEPFALTRQDKYRGLSALEGAGLIEVHRSGNRSIAVTLLCAAGETPDAILNRKDEDAKPSRRQRAATIED